MVRWCPDRGDRRSGEDDEQNVRGARGTDVERTLQRARSGGHVAHCAFGSASAWPRGRAESLAQKSSIPIVVHRRIRQECLRARAEAPYTSYASRCRAVRACEWRQITPVSGVVPAARWNARCYPATTLSPGATMKRVTLCFALAVAVASAALLMSPVVAAQDEPGGGGRGRPPRHRSPAHPSRSLAEPGRRSSVHRQACPRDIR